MQQLPNSRMMTPSVGPASYDDLPLLDPDDLGYVVGPKPAFVESFEAACQTGQLSTVQSIVSSQTRTPIFFHNGFILTLSSGRIKVAGYLLSAGAPIARRTTDSIFLRPLDEQIPLFELFTHFGWSPNTPGNYGAVVLPRVVNNLQLFSWCLDHGADPNLGQQHDSRNRHGKSDTNSCSALESAARYGDVEAVRMLLDAGAKIQNGVPLHRAAGVCPSGMNPHAGPVTPSKEFDTSRIPILKLLVERGAEVNQKENSRYKVAGYAIIHAVMAGAIERVRWLIGHGANLEAKGPWGSAADCLRGSGSEEMRGVMEGTRAQRWLENATKPFK